LGDQWWNPDLVNETDPELPLRRRRRRRGVGKDASADQTPVAPKQKKKDGVRKGVMLHIKRQCHRCYGTGRAACQICGGAGQHASGTDRMGNPRFVVCGGCIGTKLAKCMVCGGEGFA
jgi:hypothetical protein